MCPPSPAPLDAIVSRRRRPPAVAVVAIALSALSALTMAGCGSTTSTQPGSSSTGLPVEGRTFLSTRVLRNGTTSILPATPPGSGTLSVRFDADGAIGYHAGCNGSSSTYTIEAGVLRVPPGASTAMGCAPELHELDQWYSAFIEGGPTISLSGDTLTLARDGTTIEYLDREVAVPDRPLVGTRWTVDTVLKGGGAGGTASSSPGPKPAIELRDDGTLTYSDSCAGGHARWSKNGDHITFTDRQANPTVAPCPPPTSTEQALVEALDGTSTVTIDAQRMELRRGSGDGISLRAEEPADAGDTSPPTT